MRACGRRFFACIRVCDHPGAAALSLGSFPPEPFFRFEGPARTGIRLRARLREKTLRYYNRSCVAASALHHSLQVDSNLMAPPAIYFYHDGRHPLIYMYEPPITVPQYQAAVDELLGTPVQVGAGPGGCRVVHSGSNVRSWNIAEQAHADICRVVVGSTQTDAQ